MNSTCLLVYMDSILAPFNVGAIVVVIIIVLFGNFFSGASASNRHELRLHLNVVPTGAGVLKSRHILLH
jgi:hypothetical protein